MVLGYGEIEGRFEGIDTLSNKQIEGNKFGYNQMFVNLQYKTRSNEVKNSKGLIEFGEDGKIENFSEFTNIDNYNVENDKKLINVASYEYKTSMDCIEDYIENEPIEYEGLYYFTHFGTDVYSFTFSNNKINISWNFESLTSKDSTSFKDIRFEKNYVYAVDSYGLDFRARFVKLKCDVNSELWKGYIGLS
ncbi:MAG: hypothetical protein JSS91_08035 [Bacteroidetes bacterium]|nr:hypothetical protein [Bacteroidota bacterium]